MSTIESPATTEQEAPQNASAESCGCGCSSPQMPEVTFTTFVLSIASSGLVQLGEVPDPQTGKVEENILMAKHTIDVLAMLREKTRNGLDADELKLVEALLYELRMKYVLKAK